MTAADLPADLTWRKSSRSGSDANCVEVAAMSTAMAVRDSKDPGGAVLLFPAPRWAVFVAGMPRRDRGTP